MTRTPYSTPPLTAWLLAGLAALIVCTASAAPVPQDDSGKVKKEKGKTDPAGVSLEAKLVTKRDTYTLDLGGKTSDEFRKDLKAADKTHKYPDSPKVDLALELKNTGDKEIQIQTGGTPNVLTLQLKGKGAESVTYKGRMMPRIYILPKNVTLAPGKSVTIPIKSLNYGQRNLTNGAYWTQPGKYTLTATYVTGVNPAPKGTAADNRGFGRVTVNSAPLTMKVTDKK
jgi:hypothetical protein